MTLEQLLDELYNLVDSGRISPSAVIKMHRKEWVLDENGSVIHDFAIDYHPSASSYNTLILEEL